MREQIKQLLKNAVYRTIGETANGDRRRRTATAAACACSCTTRSTTCPTTGCRCRSSLFDEQMAQLRELGYTVVDLDAVLDHYVDGAPLPDGAVLITFDDGYRDNLENAAPVLHKHGYPAVQFVPLALHRRPPAAAARGAPRRRAA